MKVCIGVLTLLVAACGSAEVYVPADEGLDATGIEDTGLVDGADSMGGDAGPECICDEANECCDGCMLRAGAAGLPCETGLECEVDGVCQADGTCHGSNPCLVDSLSAECRESTCDEVEGCSWRAIREEFECSDEAGYHSSNCQHGLCVGTRCECDEITECCDGCFLQLAGTPCGNIVEMTQCDPENSCPGTFRRLEGQQVCTGLSSTCEAVETWVDKGGASCSTIDICVQFMDTANCVEDPSCR